MADNKQVQYKLSYIVEFHEAALQKAKADAKELLELLDNLENRMSSTKGLGAPQSSAPTPQQSTNPGVGFSPQPGTFVTGAPPPGFASGVPTSSIPGQNPGANRSMPMTAELITIAAANVQIISAGGSDDFPGGGHSAGRPSGGGGGGSKPPGQSPVSGGGGEEEGGSQPGFLGSAGMSLARTVMPYAAYALPAAMLYQAGQSYWHASESQRQYGLSIAGVSASTAAGSYQSNLLANLQVQQDRNNNSYMESYASGIGSTLTFGLTGNWVRQREAARQMDITQAQEDINYRVARNRYGYMPDSKRLLRLYTQTQQATEYDDNNVETPESAARRANMANVYQTSAEAMGPFTNNVGTNQFNKIFRINPNTDAAITNSEIEPVLRGLMSMVGPRFSGIGTSLMNGDLTGALSGARTVGGVAASQGDLGAIMSALPAMIKAGMDDSQVASLLREAVVIQESQHSIMVSQAQGGASGATAGAIYSGIAVSLAGTGKRPGYLAGDYGAYASQMGARRQSLEAVIPQLDFQYQEAMRTGDAKSQADALTALQNAKQEASGARMAEFEAQRALPNARMEFGLADVANTRSQKQRSMATAGYGGNMDQYMSAQGDVLKTIDEEINLRKENLDALRSTGLNTKQQADLERQITDLSRTREEAERANIADSMARSTAIHEARRGTLGSEMGIQSAAYGSAGTMGMRGQSIEEARKDLVFQQQSFQQNFANNPAVDKNSPAYRNAERNVQMARQRVFEAEGTLNFTPSYDSRMKEENLGLYQDIMQNLPSAYGDMRSAMEGGLRIKGSQLDDLNKQYQKQMGQATSEEARRNLQMEYTRTRNSLVKQMLPYEKVLESDWTDRMRTELVNMGGNFDLVAPEITRREGSLFYGILNRTFGGTAKQSETWRGKAPLYAEALFGNTDEGQRAAMYGGGGMVAPVKFDGSLNITVHIQNPDGSYGGSQRETARMTAVTDSGEPQAPRPFVGG